ncbi:MAG: hypothetical protein A3G38_04740 [Omnitrophica WOR_2 bacterium RIFCSPLOWO2_12_FULL_51_8]|nr:MAG: hypothetical protein A3G38_04740 [Omnitrophica WOR_2 bacterium RIFCSPLOWO2_12_FULL_51_8]
MKRARRVFLSILIFSAILPAGVFAVPAELKAIREIEEREKTPPAEIVIERPRVKFDEEAYRDPFKEPVIKIQDAAAPQETQKKQIPLPALTLQGLIWGGIFPQAIINNKVLKIGDIIERARVTNISKDGVVVFFEGEQFSLPAPAAGIRKDKRED